MEAGDGETRLTRRGLSEGRSREITTTIENPMAGNPFAALTAQAGEIGISDEDSENEVTDTNWRARDGA
jgi:hypothetical protein